MEILFSEKLKLQRFYTLILSALNINFLYLYLKIYFLTICLKNIVVLFI